LGFDPTFIGGAVVNPLGGNAKLGSGPVIGEVDESDGSLVRIPASVKVVLNLDDDHLPFYGTMENLAATVHRFILGRPHNSIAVLNYNDPLLREWITLQGVCTGVVLVRRTYALMRLSLKA